MEKKKIIIAATGASGAIYTYVLLKKLHALKSQFEECSIVFTKNAIDVWNHEIGEKHYLNFGFNIYENNDFFSPIASGSSKFSHMVICPCSMGMLGRIANGTSDDLISRAADVILKERKKLVLVTREAPLNIIHINNMKTISEAGGIVCPASPSFYSKPASLEELAETIVDRILSLIDIENESYKWGYNKL